MKLEDYKIGMRVKRIIHGDVPIDAEGTVLKIADSGVWVEFDNMFEGGCDLEGLCKTGYGWRCDPDYIEPILDTFELNDEGFFKILEG